MILKDNILKNYSIVEVRTLHDIITNEDTIFLIIEASNNKYYQIKLPTYFSNPVTKEYLANYIGTTLNFPVPCGQFVKFDFNFFNTIYSQYPDIIDIDDMVLKKDIVLYATEWLMDTKQIHDEEELLEVVDEIIENKKEFYSVYVFDFLLCNFDRHYKNFIIDDNLKIYFIDHEKSFGDKDYSQLNKNIDYKGCVYFYPRVSYLYEYITCEEQFKNIVYFLDIISSLQITEQMFNIFVRQSSYSFEFDNDKIKTDIIDFLTFRIKNLSEYMIETKKECFDAIS